MHTVGVKAPRSGADIVSRLYTEPEDAEIARRRRAGENWPTIAAALGRSPLSARLRYRAVCERVTVVKPLTKQRKCLRCLSLFDSVGPGNRICEPCSSQNTELSDCATDVSAVSVEGLVRAQMARVER